MDVNISVIIPNYNYARFLERRFNSIINQTVKPSEIIFLDDCSSDDSVAVAREFLKKSNIPYRIITNKVNQGVFKQWLKGIELIQYDYFWIAEADDYCALNFLESLLPAFDDVNVVMAYCVSSFINNSGVVTNDYKSYIERYLDFSRWSTSYVNIGIVEVKEYFSILNIIPNVSSVIFNKKILPQEKLINIVNYKYNGDWLFYLYCLMPETNKIAFINKELNYFVRHESSIYGDESRSTGAINELLSIANFMRSVFNYDVKSKSKILKVVADNVLFWPLDKDGLILLSNLLMSPASQLIFYEQIRQCHDDITEKLKSSNLAMEEMIVARDLTINSMEEMIVARDWAMNSMEQLIDERDLYIKQLEQKLIIGDLI